MFIFGNGKSLLSFYTHTVYVDREREWSMIAVRYLMSLLDHIIELLYKKFCW